MMLTQKQIENASRQARFGFYRAIFECAEKGQDLGELKVITDKFNDYVNAFPGFLPEEDKTQMEYEYSFLCRTSGCEKHND